MTPRFTFDNVGDGRSANTMFSRQATNSGSSSMSNTTDTYLFGGQFSPAMVFTERMVCAPFLLGIENVIALCPKTEMSRSNAEPIVAGMHDDPLPWMSAGGEVEHQTVGEPRLSLEAGVPISVRTSSTSPEPAVFGFVDVFVESVDGVGERKAVVSSPSLHGGTLTSLQLGVK